MKDSCTCEVTELGLKGQGKVRALWAKKPPVFTPRADKEEWNIRRVMGSRQARPACGVAASLQSWLHMTPPPRTHVLCGPLSHGPATLPPAECSGSDFGATSRLSLRRLQLLLLPRGVTFLGQSCHVVRKPKQPREMPVEGTGPGPLRPSSAASGPPSCSASQPKPTGS